MAINRCLVRYGIEFMLSNLSLDTNFRFDTSRFGQFATNSPPTNVKIQKLIQRIADYPRLDGQSSRLNRPFEKVRGDAGEPNSHRFRMKNRLFKFSCNSQF